MIKSYFITTTEIDDAKAAAKEAADQAASIPLLANTIGIVFAHPEFAPSAAYAEIANVLPFPVIGMTTISHCAGGKTNTYMLSVMVLTSDDCGFECGLSDPIRPDGGNAGEAARGCYDALRAKLSREPEFAFIYSPFLPDAVQSFYVDAIAEANANLPLFGAVANDAENLTHTGHCVFFGDKAYTDRIAMALVTGGSPKFYIASLTEEAMIMPRVGVITAAERNRIIEVNNMDALSFLKSIGFLSSNNVLSIGLLSSILVMHTRDGGNISRIPFIADSTGIRCGGRIMKDVPLSIAFNTKELVLQTAKSLTDTIRANHEGGTVILHTCIGRRFGLLGDPMAELELICNELGGGFNYTAVYSSGEMCPYKNGGEIKNIEYNQALIACVF